METLRFPVQASDKTDVGSEQDSVNGDKTERSNLGEAAQHIEQPTADVIEVKTMARQESSLQSNANDPRDAQACVEKTGDGDAQNFATPVKNVESFKMIVDRNT